MKLLRPFSRCAVILLGVALTAVFSTSPAAAAPLPPAQIPAPVSDFEISLVAEAPDIQHPSVVCTSPDGRVFVGEDPMDIRTRTANVTEGRIIVFHPDGRRTVFADRLHAPFGMQYHDGKLWVLHNPRLTVFTDGGDTAAGSEDLIASTNPNPWALDWNDHVPANFRFAADGWVYFATGDKGLYGAVGRDGVRFDFFGGGIFRMRPDGTRLQAYATGLRNILDVALTDRDELFTYDNTDEQQWMSRLTHIIAGGYYGYPWDFLESPSAVLPCMADYGGGAATGVFADTEDGLPEHLRGHLFLADFGKRNILDVSISPAGATYRADSRRDLFPNPPPDFRPVGIAPSPDGRSIYICDWAHRDTKNPVVVGRLWKLTATSPPTQAARPAWWIPAASGKPFEATDADLVAALDHPSRNVRFTAQRRLAERAPAILPRLIESIANPQTTSRTRYHLLWLLAASPTNAPAREAIIRVLASPSTPIEDRAAAARVVGEARIGAALGELLTASTRNDSQASLQAIIALGRIAHPRSIEIPINRLSTTRSPWIRFAAADALRSIGLANPKWWRTILRGLDSHEEVNRNLFLPSGVKLRMIPATPAGSNNRPDTNAIAGILATLRYTYDPVLVTELATLARSTNVSTAARMAALEALGSLHLQRPPWKGEWWAYHPANQPRPLPSVPWEGSSSVAAAIEHHLANPIPEIRAAACKAAAIARLTNAIPLLVTRFPAETTGVQIGILNAFEQLQSTNAVPLLASLLESDDTQAALLGPALRIASHLKSPELAAPVAHVLNAEDRRSDVRLIAATTLGDIGGTLAGGLLAPHTHSPNNELAATALHAYSRTGSPPAPLVAALQAPDPKIRQAAIAGLGRLRNREAVPALVSLRGGKDPAADLLRALGSMPDLRALDVFVDELGSRNAELREISRNAIRSLGDAALPGVEARAGNLSPLALSELQSLYRTNELARKGPLFAQAASDNSNSPEAYLAHIARDPGRSLQGRRLFHDLNGVACIRCHRINNDGGNLGPDLTTIGSQFDRSALAEAILFPSRAIREGYQLTLITLDDDSLSGIVESESAEAVRIRTSQGDTLAVPKRDIRDRQTSSTSLMPEGLHAALSPSEFADLIAYLETLRSAAPRPANAP